MNLTMFESLWKHLYTSWLNLVVFPNLILRRYARVFEIYECLRGMYPNSDVYWDYSARIHCYHTNNYQAAIESWEECYRLRPHRGILFEIGMCYFYLGKSEEAKDYLTRFMDDAELGKDRVLIAEAEKMLAHI